MYAGDFVFMSLELYSIISIIVLLMFGVVYDKEDLEINVTILRSVVWLMGMVLFIVYNQEDLQGYGFNWQVEKLTLFYFLIKLACVGIISV